MRRIFSYAIVAMLACICTTAGASSGVTIVSNTKSAPVQFGLSDLEKAAAGSNASNMRIIVSVGNKGEAAKVVSAAKARLSVKPGSFVIAKSARQIAIAGSDEAGTMYGCFELAERLKMDGAKAFDVRIPISQSPYTEFRAVNPFLTLPYGDENNWWFLSDDFWKGYIDMLARARVNWIDLHGMYDIKTTWFPNIYPYFIKSDKFPEAGAPPEVADKNLAMLNKVIRMAKSRGIKFALMSYSATWKGPGLRTNTYEESEANLAEYTRECVKKLIQSCPDLAMIGFRIGESGKSEEFFRNSYIPAIKESGRDIPLYTRSWGAKKSNILDLGKAFPGRLFVEIKYNGEQYGPPYMIAGGRMMGWKDYSYQGYFSYPKNYKVIWQVRQNGTHRVFPWGNPDFAALTTRNSKLGGAVGFCAEPINSYYPSYDYLHKDGSSCNWYKWVYQRDWFFYDVWGRMAYSPNTPEKVWIAKFKEHYGAKAGEDFYRAFTTASKIIPFAKTFYSLGPDHRNHAPELETGGHIDHWAREGGFDTANVQSPDEFAKRLVERNPSARMTPIQAAYILSKLSDQTLTYLDKAKKDGSDSREFHCLSSDMEMLADLGRYYSARLTSATDYSLFKLTRVKGFADEARKYHNWAISYWTELAALGENHYKPFVDTLRMGTEKFTWTEEGKKLQGDIKPLDDLLAEGKLSNQAPLISIEPQGDKTGPKVEIRKTELSSVVEGAKTFRVYARVSDPAGVKSVLLKFKTMPSETPWQTIEMKQDKGLWVGSVPVIPDGLMWGIEALDKKDNGSLWPSFLTDIPYRVIDPWDGTKTFAPSITKSLESIIKGKPGQLKYSAMLIGKDSQEFTKLSAKVKSDVLKAVEMGTTLVIDNQEPGKFDTSWLPGNVSLQEASFDKITLDKTCPLFKDLGSEMKKNRRWQIHQGQLVTEDPGWKFVTDPKVLAIRNHGKGKIIFMQLGRNDRLGDFGATNQMVNLTSYACGKNDTRPVLVLDPGDGDLITRLQALNMRVLKCGK